VRTTPRLAQKRLYAGLISYCHYRGKQHATTKDQNVVDAISQSEDVLFVYFSQPQCDVNGMRFIIINQRNSVGFKFNTIQFYYCSTTADMMWILYYNFVKRAMVSVV
jgi:hypothetical protein